MPISRTIQTDKVRIFLVEDHPIVRRGFEAVLELTGDMMVCGEADNAAEAIKLISEVRPDLVVLDLALKRSTGLSLINFLRHDWPNVKVLVFSMHDSMARAQRVLRAGAHGYVSKDQGIHRVVQAIRALLRGHTYLYVGSSQPITAAESEGVGVKTPGTRALSIRELEILEHIGHGLGSREIAAKLHLSPDTVASHRAHIKDKLGISSAAELVHYAFKWIQS